MKNAVARRELLAVVDNGLIIRQSNTAATVLSRLQKIPAHADATSPKNSRSGCRTDHTIYCGSDLLHAFFRRFRESVERTEWKVGIDTHQRILDLLVAGEVAGATQELRKHIASHKERIR